LSQPARPLSPSLLLPLGQRGRMVESPTRTQNSIISIHNTARQVLDYSTRGVYLLRRSLGDLQFLGDALACHIARLPWLCRESGLQASRWIIDEGHIRQSKTAEPGPQLEPLLQRLPVLLVGRIFNGDGVVTLADFTPPLALPSSGISTSRGGEAGSDTNFVRSSCSKQFG
jgi:hypothetical protein